MDFSYILKTSVPQKEKLLEYGFSQNGGKYSFKKILDDDFYAGVEIEFSLQGGKAADGASSISAEVFETGTDEKYALLDVKSANGAFVGGMRGKVAALLEDIRSKCFLSAGLKEKFCQWLERDLGVKPDFPWKDSAGHAVYRCKNGKWFVLVMNVKLKSLGIENDEEVWIANMKSDDVEKAADGKSVFPAYHMSKKHWISALLTAAADFGKLKSLALKSKSLVESKK